MAEKVEFELLGTGRVAPASPWKVAKKILNSDQKLEEGKIKYDSFVVCPDIEEQHKLETRKK